MKVLRVLCPNLTDDPLVLTYERTLACGSPVLDFLSTSKKESEDNQDQELEETQRRAVL